MTMTSYAKISPINWTKIPPEAATSDGGEAGGGSKVALYYNSTSLNCQGANYDAIRNQTIRQEYAGR